MKRFLGMILSVCILLGLAAAPAFAQEVTEIQFWTWRPEDVDFYNKTIAAFEAANPDVKVVQNAIKNTEYNTILSAALAAGDGAPDVFMSRAYGGLQTFADSGYMLALDELMPELADFSDATRRGATSITDGKIYGVPAVSQTMLCYYNKDVYEELGLSIPKTWDEFLQNLEACKAAGYEALANGTKEGWCCEFLFGGVGPSFYGGNDFFDKVVAGETTFVDPIFVDAVQKIKDLTPYMPSMYEGVAYTDMQASFINGLSAHFVGGSYEAGYFGSENPDLNFDIFAVPGEKAEDPAYVSVYADMNFSIAASSKKQEAALKFLQFLATKEFGESMVNELKMVSSVPGVDVSANPFIARVLELQANNTPYLFLVGFRYEQPTGSSLFQAEAQSLMVGDKTAQEICQSVQDGIASYYAPFQK
ncbi:MAG: extracellular solute-binding protein [Candidatus Limiplasma sp.]|nr:extracellular solute-binding protein [Candidatus Limiplasma sp.]